MISRFFYDLGIRLYAAAIRLKALSDDKARQWISGRSNWEEVIAKDLANVSQKRIWIHCASLGEFEQGRPVLDQLKADFPDHILVLTFFSPSGYNVRKEYPHADYIYYLPLDTARNARIFIDLLQPSIALFVKYEYWYHLLHQLTNRQIPVILFSAIFRKDQVFFSWYGSLFRKMLKMYSKILVQDQASQVLLGEIGIKHVGIAPDTRFDRVTQIAAAARSLPVIEAFKKDEPLIVAGSTWPADLSVFQKTNLTKARLILAPHDISEQSIQQIEQTFPRQTIRYSKADATSVSKRILIIDNIGLLASIYQYASLAYIGGGFGEGIHNTLEPAVFGIPVLFGPKHEKFREARALINCNGGYSSGQKNKIAEMINTVIGNKETREKMGANAALFVSENTGGTQLVIQEVKAYL